MQLQYYGHINAEELLKLSHEYCIRSNILETVQDCKVVVQIINSHTCQYSAAPEHQLTLASTHFKHY